jgi:hypothetical protein
MIAVSVGCAVMRDLMRRRQLAHVAVVRLTAALGRETALGQIRGAVSIETEASSEVARACLDAVIAPNRLLSDWCRDLGFADVTVSVHSSVHIRL